MSCFKIHTKSLTLKNIEKTWVFSRFFKDRPFQKSYKSLKQLRKIVYKARCHRHDLPRIARNLPILALGFPWASFWEGWASLGRILAVLATSWAPLGRSWAFLGHLLGAPWVVLGVSWVPLGPLGCLLGAS